MSEIEDPVAWVAAQPAQDPVRRRVLHALALRAQAQPPGALRDKLIAALQRRASREPPESPPRDRLVVARPLPALLALLQADAGAELRQVRAHQHTWRQLRVARSMGELNNTPLAGHLGPLNGQALAMRALQQIQRLAPDYLHRLLTQMDTLAVLERLPATAEADKADKADKAPRTGRKKAADKRP